jgi:hypothetical protein
LTTSWLPVGALTAPDSALFLWVVDCKIPEGLAVGSAWRFTYKTVAFTWVKTTKGLGRVAPPWWSDAREMRDRAAGRDGLRLLADASDEILVIYRLRRSSGQLTRLRRNRLPQPKRGVRNV